jgi:glycosyltransferase involved in cell wall biosynthesis
MFISKILSVIFKHAIKKSNIISVTNSKEKEQVEKLSGVEPIIISNGISLETFNSLKKIELKKQLNKVNLTYIGNVGIAQELECLIELADDYRDSIVVNIIGDGARLKYLNSLSRKRNLRNINFIGKISPLLISDHIEKSDILFAQIGKKFSSAVPTKIFEYLASSRKALLGLPDGQAKEIFKDFYGVKIFPVGDYNELKRNYEIIKDLTFVSEMAKKNKSILINKFIREDSVKNYLHLLKDSFNHHL